MTDQMTANPQLDGESNTGAIIGLSVAFAFMSLVIVSCRIYTRAMLKSIGIDDAAIIVAEVRLISFSVGSPALTNSRFWLLACQS